jgi:hypothetical protein
LNSAIYNNSRYNKTLILWDIFNLVWIYAVQNSLRYRVLHFRQDEECVIFGAKVSKIYISRQKKKKTRFCSLKIPEYSKKLTNPQYGKSYKTLLCGIQSHLTSHSHKKLQAPKGNKLQATQVNSKFCQWHLPTLKSFLLLTNFTPKADCTHDLNSMISIL